MPVLDTARFQSNNTRHRPVIDALNALKANRGTTNRYYDVGEVPLDRSASPTFLRMIEKREIRCADLKPLRSSIVCQAGVLDRCMAAIRPLNKNGQGLENRFA